MEMCFNFLDSGGGGAELDDGVLQLGLLEATEEGW